MNLVPLPRELIRAWALYPLPEQGMQLLVLLAELSIGIGDPRCWVDPVLISARTTMSTRQACAVLKGLERRRLLRGIDSSTGWSGRRLVELEQDWALWAWGAREATTRKILEKEFGAHDPKAPGPGALRCATQLLLLTARVAPRAEIPEVDEATAAQVVVGAELLRVAAESSELWGRWLTTMQELVAEHGYLRVQAAIRRVHLNAKWRKQILGQNADKALMRHFSQILGIG